MAVGTRRRGVRYAGIETIRGELGQREALHRLRRYLIPLWRPIGVGFLFTLTWSAINLFYGKLLKDFLDGLEAFAGKGDMRPLNSFTAIAIFVFIARAACYFGKNYAWAYAAQKLTMRLRNEVYGHLQRMSQAFFDHTKTGQLMSCLSSDVPAVTAVLDAIQDFIYSPIVLIGGVLLLFYLNWPLALLSLCCLPPIAVIILRAASRMKTYTDQLQTGRARVLDIAEETLASVRVVRSFGNEDYEIERFDRRSENVFRSVLRTTRVSLAMRPLVELIGTIAVVLVIWFGGKQIMFALRDDPTALTPGKLTWFVLVLKQVADAARDFGNISVNLSAAGVAADRVFTVLSIRSEIQEKPEAIELKDVKGRVEFRAVSFAYSAGIKVLDGVSFSMEPGEVVALVGLSGAGKTTIAALIPRLYDVREGAVLIDGVDVRDCTIRSLRAQIGIVPQETVLFAGTVRENIAYGRLDASDEEIVAAAKTANVWEFVEKLPEGLETRIGERGARLSGGQRQRIAIARAVLRDPRVLILDEATSSLDTQSELLVQEALQRLVASRTTLVIAHRLSTIRNADTILLVHEGRIVERGRHEELLAAGGAYSELYRTQFRGEDQAPRGERAE